MNGLKNTKSLICLIWQFRARGRRQDSEKLGEMRVGIRFKWRTVASWDCGNWILETGQLIRICSIYGWLFLTKQRLCWLFCIFHKKCIKFPVQKDQWAWVRFPRLDLKLLVFKWKTTGLVSLLIFFSAHPIYSLHCMCLYVCGRQKIAKKNKKKKKNLSYSNYNCCYFIKIIFEKEPQNNLKSQPQLPLPSSIRVTIRLNWCLGLNIRINKLRWDLSAFPNFDRA